jgi:hypothetical protein
MSMPIILRTRLSKKERGLPWHLAEMEGISVGICQAVTPGGGEGMRYPFRWMH